MVCTYCGAKTQVTNSRHQKRPNDVWRRRHCLGCGAVFSTIERVDYEKSWVVQYAADPIAPFLRDKLLLSIYKACQHRPTAMEDAAALSTTVIARVRTLVKSGTLRSDDLARATHQTLRHFDEPAAVSYQAFHADLV